MGRFLLLILIALIAPAQALAFRSTYLDYSKIFVVTDSMFTANTTSGDMTGTVLRRLQDNPPAHFTIDDVVTYSSGSCYDNPPGNDANYFGYGMMGGSDIPMPYDGWRRSGDECAFADDFAKSNAGYVLICLGTNDYGNGIYYGQKVAPDLVTPNAGIYYFMQKYIRELTREGRIVMWVTPPMWRYWFGTHGYNQPLSDDNDATAPYNNLVYTPAEHPLMEDYRLRNEHWIENQLIALQQTYDNFYVIPTMRWLITSPQFSGWNGVGTPGYSGVPTWADITKSISQTFNDVYIGAGFPHMNDGGCELWYNYVLSELEKILSYRVEWSNAGHTDEFITANRWIPNCDDASTLINFAWWPDQYCSADIETTTCRGCSDGDDTPTASSAVKIQASEILATTTDDYYEFTVSSGDIGSTQIGSLEALVRVAQLPASGSYFPIIQLVNASTGDYAALRVGYDYYKMFVMTLYDGSTAYSTTAWAKQIDETKYYRIRARWAPTGGDNLYIQVCDEAGQACFSTTSDIADLSVDEATRLRIGNCSSSVGGVVKVRYLKIYDDWHTW